MSTGWGSNLLKYPNNTTGCVHAKEGKPYRKESAFAAVLVFVFVLGFVLGVA
jgi:hypothetical protein